MKIAGTRAVGIWCLVSIIAAMGVACTSKSKSSNDGGSSVSVITTSLTQGNQSAAYSQQLQASGGNLPYTWTVSSGNLPTGITLGTGGLLSGTPTADGQTTFAVQVADSASPPQTATASLSLTIGGQVAVTTTTLPNPALGAPYSQQLTASGGTGPYVWAVATGSLPPGLTLSGAGLLSGSATTLGTSTFTVTATDASNLAVVGTSSTYALVVNGIGSLAISTNILPTAVQNISYTAVLSAVGGVGPYVWSITSGGLPSGMQIVANGALTGTPTALGTYALTVQVSDGSSPAQQSSASLSLNVVAPLGIITTSASLPNGDVGTAYSTTLDGTGGTAPYVWAVSSGSTLPAGLSISSGGVISGTPTAFGTSTISLQLTDASSPALTATSTVDLIIIPQLVVNTPALNNAVAGAAYSVTLSASGGSGTYFWALTSGTLPANLTLSVTGVISGTPSATGVSSNLQITATDSGNPVQQATQTYSLAVNGAGTLTITTSSLLAGTQGAPYVNQLNGTGGTQPYAWSAPQANLPPGLTLNSSMGSLSGTPSSSGSFAFTVTLNDATLPTAKTTTQALQLNIASGLSISTSTLPGGVSSAPYSAGLNASGGTTPYTWALTAGSLPSGLSLNSANGVISGTPPSQGSSTFTVMATDSGPAPAQVATKQLTIAVAGPLAFSSTSPLDPGIINTAFTTTLAATGGTTPYTWAVAAGSSLPAGLSFNVSTGVLSGTPTGSGLFSFKLRVNDSSSPTQYAFSKFRLNVSSPLQVSSPGLPSGTVGVAYFTQLSATGGNAPYSWTTSGSLPAGLALSAAGILSGTPQTSGTANFAVTVTDGTKTPTAASATQNLSMIISPAGTLTVTTSSLPGGVTNSAYPTTSLTSANGTGTVSWTAPQGSLPPGVTLSIAGSLSGTPTSLGNYSVTVTATDSSSTPKTATRSLSIAVTAPLLISSTTLPLAIVGKQYNTTLAASGGTTPYTWSLSAASGSQFPSGLALSQPTGVISGTPSQSIAGVTTLSIIASDASNPVQSVTASVSLRLDSAMTFTGDLPPATTKVPYSKTLTVTGGTAPYTWSVSGGRLPTGLTLSNTGVVSGTPTAKGNFNSTLLLKDTYGQVFTKNYSVQVN